MAAGGWTLKKTAAEGSILGGGGLGHGDPEPLACANKTLSETKTNETAKNFFLLFLTFHKRFR